MENSLRQIFLKKTVKENKVRRNILLNMKAYSMSREESRQCGSAEEKDLDQHNRIDKLKLFQGMVLCNWTTQGKN